MRLINIVFSPSFFPRFRELNDRKSRHDHESGNIPGSFWKDVAEEYGMIFESCGDDNINVCSLSAEEQNNANINCATDDDVVATDDDVVANAEVVDSNHVSDSLLVVVNHNNDSVISQLQRDPTVNLCDVDLLTSPVLAKKKVATLFKIRQKIKGSMTVSGTHSPDVYDNFLQIAMNKVNGGRSFNKDAVYYFYNRCEEYPDLDDAFQQFLDPEIRGATIDNNVSDLDNSESPSTAGWSSVVNTKRETRKEREQQVAQAIVLMGDIAPSIHEQLKQSNLVAEAAVDEARLANKVAQIANEETKRNNYIHNRIEVAKALGDVEELRKIMREMSSTK